MTVWKRIGNFFGRVGRGIWAFLSAGAEVIAENGGKLLMQSALEAVVAAEAAGGNGGDKFKVAKDTVIAKLRVAGIPIVLNAVHLAIENAVAEMNRAK
jgi:hypothetical protein